MKKSTLIVCLLLALTLIATGCNPKPITPTKGLTNTKIETPSDDNKKPVEPTTEPNDGSENEDDYYDGAVGEIMEFDGENVHIIFGDIVDIFKVKQDVSKNCYLGESVKLTKDGDYYNLEASLDNDYSIKHTNMGDIITSITGTVKEDAKGKKFIVVAGDKEYAFENYEDITLKKDTNITVEYIQHASSEDKILIAIYNNDATLELIVDSIERTEKGIMALNTKKSSDSEAVEYIVYVDGGTSVEFNHSELTAGSLIMVYPETIRESEPAEVDAQRLLIGVIN